MVNVFHVTLLSDVENMRCPPNLSTLKRRLKIAIAFIIKTEILHLLIQKTLNYIKANQVLTKDKTGVPVGILDFEGKLWLWTSLPLHQPYS